MLAVTIGDLFLTYNGPRRYAPDKLAATLARKLGLFELALEEVSEHQLLSIRGVGSTVSYEICRLAQNRGHHIPYAYPDELIDELEDTFWVFGNPKY